MIASKPIDIKGLAERLEKEADNMQFNEDLDSMDEGIELMREAASALSALSAVSAAAVRTAKRCEGQDDPEERCPRHPSECACWAVDLDAARSLAASAQEAGLEPVAWIAEGCGWKRVFLNREAAEKLAGGGDGKVTPLYASPNPIQPTT